MKFARTLLMGLGSVALVASFLILVAPKTAHAVVATLVNVVNDVAVVNPTPSGTIQPIITTETDSLSRVPYQDGCVTVYNSTVESLICFTSAVPAGKRLVVEEVTAACYAPTGKVTGASISAATDSGAPFAQHFLVLTPQDSIVGSPGNHYTTSELVRFYEDPGHQAEFEFYSGDSLAQCSSTLSGYLEPTNVQ